MKGKVALVTGAGRGIGHQAAMEFSRRGAAVAVCDIDLKAAERVTWEISDAGGRAVAIRADIRSEADVRAMVDTAVRELGDLDCAFNNAGIIGPIGTPLHELTVEQWDQVLDIDLKGVWLCMKHELAAMLQRRKGSIVNNASIVGLRGATFNPAYGAAKHGVVGISRAAASYYAQYNIRINALCPGVVNTAMTTSINSRPDALSAERVKRTPMRRGAEALEIARAAAWLCSDDSSYITGVALPVDGGSSVV